MKIAFMVLFLGLSGGSAQASARDIFIGNGGEGIVNEEGVYVRDLAESDLHRTPFVGRRYKASVLRALKDTSVASLPVDLEMLAKKLQDLDQFSPQLGRFALSVFGAYDWVLVTEDLVPVPYDGSTLVNRRQRVTLANRYRWTVRLHRPNFMKMNQGNRVALLIHEALFSMLRPESEGGALQQQPFRIREMVATLFSPPERGARWRSSFDDALVIPEVGFRRSCQVGEQALLWSTEGDRKRPFELSETDWRSRFGEVARSICMRSGDEIVELVFTRPGFRAVELSFLQSRGTAEHRQVYLGFIPVAARFSWKGRLPRLAEEPRVCEAFLRGLANPWYGYDPGTFSTDSLYACEMPRP